jgi:PAS domain S-box-containing protein
MIVTDTENTVALTLLDRVFGNVSVVFYTAAADVDFTLTWVSFNCARVLGLPSEYCVGVGAFWRERIHPEDMERVLRELGGLSWNGHVKQEFRLRDATDNFRWVENDVSFRSDRVGDTVYLAGCLRDIDAQKNAAMEHEQFRETVQAREHFYRSVLDSMPLRLFWKDRNSVFRGCNRSGAKALNLKDPDDIVGKSDYDFYSDREEADYLRILDEQVMSSGEASYHCEVPAREADVWLDVSKVPLRDESGKVYGVLVCYKDVSVLKRSEMALNKFKRAVEGSSNSVFITDARGTIEYVNPTFIETYGYDESTALGNNPRMLQSGLTSGDIYRELWQTITSGRNWSGELANRCRDGNIVWQSVSISPIVDDMGTISHFLAIEDDITRHKTLESGLKRQLDFIQALIDALPHPIYYKGSDGRYQRVNRAFEEFSHMDGGGSVGKTVFDIFPHDLAVQLKAMDDALFARPGRNVREFHLLERDGSARDILSHKATFTDEHGKAIGIIGSHFDITEYKRVEAALAENEARLRELTSTVGEGIYVVDEQQVITFVNPAAVKMLGWSEQKLIGQDVHRIFNCQGHADSAGAVADPCCLAELIRQSQRTLRSQGETFLRKDGMPFPVSVIASPIMREGRYAGAVVAFHDITEQQFTQRLLDNTLQELRTVLDNAQIGVAYLREGKFSWINRYMEQMFGHTIDELRNESLSILCGNSAQDQKVCECGMLQDLGKNQVYECEHQMMRRSGEKFWCHQRGVAIDPDDPAAGSIWIMLDIDKLKKTEHRLKALNESLAQRVDEETRKSLEKERLLIQQGRNAAMGEMIGNIAHQWRQPLSTLGVVIQNIHSDFREGVLDEGELAKYVDTAKRVIQRMSCTIDDFRDFFRPSRVKEQFSIYQSIEETIRLLAAMLKNNGIEIALTGDPDLVAYGHPNEFSQVILNFVVNAKDALVERKTPKGHIDIALNVRDGNGAVTIRDNAGGIDEDQLEKIFDPYYTTKANGTGIGLHMNRTIIEQHMSGSITCRNLFDREQRLGAEFSITIPLHHDETESCREVTI